LITNIQTDITNRATTAKLFSRLRAGASRSKLTAGSAILFLFLIVALFAEFIAPYDYRDQLKREQGAPPSTVHFRDAGGTFHLRPFIHPRKLVDPLARRYEEQTSRIFPIRFFVTGQPYRLFGFIHTNRHFFGVESPPGPDETRLQLLGTDAIGRDRFSRLLIASRFSLIVSPAGTLLAALFGILLGCIAGYGGKVLDVLLMRAADAMLALPVLVLILAARAAFPLELPPVRAASLIILIFAAVGWAEMARLTRGLVRSLRKREYVAAAISIGASQGRVLFRHILPNALRPLAIQIMLMLPIFLLTETSLSYLGVGLQEPEPSWGNMLTAASDLTLLRDQPFIVLTPALCIFLVVLAVRFLSDWARDQQER
jgi:peptide/nickel transport system permease protein